MCNMGIRIKGTGYYVPDEVVTNQDLSLVMSTSDEWIQARSGIKERRRCTPEQSCSDIALEASKKALDNAGLNKDELDCILISTITPDHVFPGTGCFLQAKLGCPGIPVFDIQAQCSGFLYTMTAAKSLLASGQYKNALVVGAEVHSKGLDYSDAGRDVTVLFGDGAAAVVLEKDESDAGILDIEIAADGRGAKDLWLEAPGMAFPKWDITEEMRQERQIYPHMNGKKVFQYATEKMATMARNLLAKHDLTEQDIGLVICHQANARIIDYVRKSLGWQAEKFYVNIDRYANTTSASIPLALSEAIDLGKVKTGDRVLMLAFGSGFTWGSCLLKL
jgi:3-oxoacyl-[acyl-carrier-protein] synthase III